MSKSPECTPAEMLAGFERKLRYHDWRFEYSDDPTAYRVGLAERDQIAAMRISLENAGLGAEAAELYQKYAPGAA